MTNGIGRVGWRNYVTTVPTYPTSLKLFIDAGNTLSYSGSGTTVTDLTGNKNGTLENGTAYSSANGGTFVFDGVNDYIYMDNNLYNYNEFSVSFWVNLSSFAHCSPFQNFNYNGAGYFGFQILILSGHPYIAFYDGTSSTGPTLYSPTQLELNKYYRVTFTKQASGSIKLYINGILDSTTNTTFNPVYHPTNNYSTIGCQLYTSGGGITGSKIIAYLLNGKLAGLKVGNTVWTASEALADFNEFKTRYGYVSYTTRTAAFATATGITDTTILNALNTFDTGLISNGLDTKLKALYPFVGGTSTAHKFNFMDARDLNAAFRLQFNGGWTHNSNGIQGNGTNTFANTYFIPSSQLTLTSGHYSIYSRTDILQSTIDLGVWSSNGSTHQIITRLNGDLIYSYAGSNVGIFIPNSNSLGHYVLNRNSSTNTTGYKNGTQVANGVQSAGLPIEEVFIGGRNQNGTGTVVIPTSRQYAFASMGNGLTDAESTTFYTLVQALQTTLGRQV
jgi:hypothetical protein